MDMMNITNYESVKDNLMIVVRNKSFVEKKKLDTFEEVGDMMIIPALYIDKTAIAYIRSGIRNAWGFTKSELIDHAKKNSQNVMPMKFMKMCDILGIPDNTDVPMYVLTNVDQINGASCLFYEGVMKSVSDLYFGGRSFCVLPSSIHELIVVEYNTGIPTSIVHDVNTDLVDVEDRLSDHVYVYDANKKTLLVF